MATLYSSLSPNHGPRVAEYRKVVYVNNGWNAMRRWNGMSSTAELAGIAGPSVVADAWSPTSGSGYAAASGSSTIGVHVFRYRYMDSRTGYVSDPSNEWEILNAASGEKLTFDISTTGSDNMIRSTDAKVDTIILESTVVGSDDTGGAEFFEAARSLQTASTIAFDIDDASLEAKLLDYPATGHLPPPIAQNIHTHRERLWLYGQVVHSTGSATFTQSSVDVAEGATDPDWNTEALGSASGESSIPWLILIDGGTTAYEIDYYDSGNSKIVLKKAFAEATESNAGYKIFSRAHAIWVSNPDYPEGFTPLKFLSGPQNEMAGDLTAGMGYGGSMLFWSISGMYKVAWDQGPLVDPILIPLSTEYGALTQKVVVRVQGQVYSMDHHGWHSFEGTSPKLISRPVDDLRSLIDYSLAENFHGCFFPDLRAIRWFVCYTSDTGDYPKRYVQYDLDTDTWSTGQTYQGISASRLVPSATGTQVVLGDENGHTWFADQGTCDGCYAADSHLTSDAGSTAQVLQVTDTLDTTNVGLAGCFLHHVEGGEARRISSNTTSTITLASSLSSVPAEGDTFWVGPIPTKLKTKAFGGSRMAMKTRAPRLWVVFDPLASTRYLQVRLYKDLGTVGETWSTSRTTRSGMIWPGENLNYPSTDWLIDLSEGDGHVELPVGIKFTRFIEAEFEILEPDAPLEIAQFGIAGFTVEDDQ